MAGRGAPDWMRDHLSFSSNDSHFRSKGDMSGLMETREFRRDPLFKKTVDTLAALMNFTRSGLCFFLSNENLPKRYTSFIDWYPIELSRSDREDTTFSISPLKRNTLEAPLGHSSIPWTTTLNFLSWFSGGEMAGVEEVLTLVETTDARSLGTEDISCGACDCCDVCSDCDDLREGISPLRCSIVSFRVSILILWRTRQQAKQ